MITGLHPEHPVLLATDCDRSVIVLILRISVVKKIAPDPCAIRLEGFLLATRMQSHAAGQGRRRIVAPSRCRKSQGSRPKKHRLKPFSPMPKIDTIVRLRAKSRVQRLRKTSATLAAPLLGYPPFPRPARGKGLSKL